MKYVGIDLHKKTISVWVVNQERKKLYHKRLYCLPVETIVEYFRTLGEFEAVVEATASYEWLVRLIEPLAKRVVLAHPGKLRVIAVRLAIFHAWQKVGCTALSGQSVRTA